MFSGLALWQEFLLAGLALLSFVYVFYFQIWIALAVGSDLLFAAALSLAVASVAWPGLFDHVAMRIVDESPLPGALESADARVVELENLPGRLIERALESIGYEPEIAPEPLPPPEPGPFEVRVRPAVDALVALGLRTTSFICSTLLLLLALSLRSSTSSARELRKLSARFEALADETARAAAAGTEAGAGPKD